MPVGEFGQISHTTEAGLFYSLNLASCLLPDTKIDIVSIVNLSFCPLSSYPCASANVFARVFWLL